jgi:hypothetical protein
MNVFLPELVTFAPFSIKRHCWIHFTQIKLDKYMRIGIFETTHFEGAYPVIRSFDKSDNVITIFTYEESYRQFQFLFANDMSRFTWVVKGKEESKYVFMRRIYNTTKELQLQLLYLNTISDNFIFYSWMISFLKPIRVIVTLHSINNYFNPSNSFTLRGIVRTMGKKRLMRVVNEFNVVSLTMVDYLKERLPASKKVHCVPGAVYEGRPDRVYPRALPEVIKLVVPGVIDERRRDYDLVLQLLGKLQERGMQIVISLLGGISPIFGKNILQKLKGRKWEGLHYYDVPVVDQPEFDKVMDEADLVLLPSTIHNTILDNIEEVYGLTMSSGNLFDIVKHAKPFIAPLRLKVDPFLDGSCLRYESVDEIVEILSALQQSPEVWDSLKKKAKAASANYSIQAIRSRNKDLFG